MSTFNLDNQNFYMIGAHGCTPQRLDPREYSDEFASNRFFIVPDNFMIVYLTPNGVQSEGSKNILFIKNLYDYNNELFRYIFDPSNYKINLDKTNPQSYRHTDFFKSLPFFSNFNYLCNFELYPPGVHCPFIHLSFSKSCLSSSTKCYFEGITLLDNIVTPLSYGDSISFVEPMEVFNPIEHITDKNGSAYTHEIFDITIKNFGITGGVFFVSSCRAEYFTKGGEKVLVDILPVPRNCGDIEYDLNRMQDLLIQYPEARSSIETVIKRLKIRDIRKKQIDEIIKTNYLQNTSFFSNNFATAFYQYMSIVSGQIKICVNFRKIDINCNLSNLDDRTDLLVKMINYKFAEFRLKLINRQEQIQECNNNILYAKLGYIYRFVFGYVYEKKDLPSQSIFINFWNFVDSNFVENKIQMTNIVNTYMKSRYNFRITGGYSSFSSDYKTKYLKYKNKYLNLQKIMNHE